MANAKPGGKSVNKAMQGKLKKKEETAGSGIYLYCPRALSILAMGRNARSVVLGRRTMSGMTRMYRRI